MTSPVTSPAARFDPASAIAAQKQEIGELEKALWDGGLNEPRLGAYQAAYRQLEALLADSIAAGEPDTRHDFVLIIPVADRPQHLKSCLDSLLALCRAYGYGGMDNGRYRKVSAMVADDSSDPAHIAQNRELAAHYSRLGLATDCFGPQEQIALLESLGQKRRAALATVLGTARPDAFGHKGQAVMRNIAYLKLAAERETGRRVLYYSLDSDQEFQVKVGTREGDRDVAAVNFLYHLDDIFSRTNALVLTGKVVGDPPVSPAVMTGNFLEDVIAFVQQMAEGGAGACRHHQSDPHREGEAAYHDMAELFGFHHEGEVYRYRCPLAGDHGDADCFHHFASRVNSFFYGEHPTRPSHYLHQEVAGTVQPARTVYAGNYVFRPEALKFFIPFAALRLRMSGPTLGRLVRGEVGSRFVSANLPMLHKRTVEGTGHSEFRPGIATGARSIDFSGEFERQFYGDVMLFSVERLTGLGYPDLPEADIAATLDAVRLDMLEKYNGRRKTIMARLGVLEALLHAPNAWWREDHAHAEALAQLDAFVANVARNFGDQSGSHLAINATENWRIWREKLLAALLHYPADRHAWEEALAQANPGP